MELFHICDEIENGRGTFCVFGHASFERMGRRSGYPRCVRHGKMMSSTVRAVSKQEARKKIQGE
jgi:hypothetical protein